MRKGYVTEEYLHLNFTLTNFFVFLNFNFNHSVSEEDSDMVLTSFLSERAGLRQTKFTCYAGGCGSCVVTATYHDQVLDKERTVSFNSVRRCCVLLLS